MEHNLQIAADEAVTSVTKLALELGMSPQQFGDAVWTALLWDMTTADRDAWATALSKHMEPA